MLEIDDLRVQLDADPGLVRAIDGMHLSLTRGETFALVGESGCGNRMTALALMRSVKQALDPRGLFNPGVLLPD